MDRDAQNAQLSNRLIGIDGWEENPYPSTMPHPLTTKSFVYLEYQTKCLTIICLEYSEGGLGHIASNQIQIKLQSLSL